MVAMLGIVEETCSPNKGYSIVPRRHVPSLQPPTATKREVSAAAVVAAAVE